MVTAEENKAVVRRYFEGFHNGREDAILEEIMNPDLLEPTRQVTRMLLTAFPDYQLTIEDQIAEGTKVVTRLTGRGTHRGEAFGVPATGNPVTITAIFIDEVADGKLVGHWDEADILGAMQQGGALPAPGQAPAGGA